MALLALVDADYRFTYVDLGSYGSSSDGGIFSSCTLCKCLSQGGLQLPEPQVLPGAPELGPLPMVIVWG